MSAMSQATRLTCDSSGLSSWSTRSDNAAMRPSSVCIPVANTRARASPSVHVGAAEDKVARLQHRDPAVQQLRRAEGGQRLPGKH